MKRREDYSSRFLFNSMPSNIIVPARLSVLLAREAPLALIFRRGPSEWTHLIQWNTDTDTFESGAWFKGRIYSDRCDLSPNGTKLIYFVYSFSSSSVSTCWTGVSKVPWLTMLGLWLQWGTYYGGGLFETNSKVWVNYDGICYPDVEQFHPPELEVRLDCRFFNLDRLFLFRMERDGWKAVESNQMVSAPIPQIDVDDYRFQPVDTSRVSLPYNRVTHEKAKPRSSFALAMISDFDYSKRENGRRFEVRNKNKQALFWKNCYSA